MAIGPGRFDDGGVAVVLGALCGMRGAAVLAGEEQAAGFLGDAEQLAAADGRDSG